MSNFKELSKINVNAHTEKKNGLTYLSWAWAWSEFKQAYPEATYKVIKNEDNLPYFESGAGVIVYTEVTAGGITHEMWLPVMDGANNAMKFDEYEYTVWNKYKNKEEVKKVAAFDMFDVNKTIMRCLVKNLAMFGLGIYIYAGEDIPQEDKVQAPKKVTPTAGAGEDLTDDVKQYIQDQAIEIISDIEMSNSEAAYDRLQEVSKDSNGEIDNDRKVYAWSLLPSNVRTAITKHINSLKG